MDNLPLNFAQRIFISVVKYASSKDLLLFETGNFIKL